MSDNSSKAASVFKISIVGMALLTVSAVFSLRNLPSMAEYGWAVVFYLTAACLCFFVPSALVSAELASTYPINGGVFVWVKEAFGPRWGFLAIFMEWVQNLPWYPAVLTFVASSLAYAIDPAIAQNKWFVFIVVQVLMWSATLLNFKGMKLSVLLSNTGVVVGTVIPGAVIILLAVFYVLKGGEVRIPFEGVPSLIPDLADPTQLMLLAGMMVGLAGMEMTSIHVLQMNDPTRSFPKAIFLATLIVIALSVLGSLAIAIVVPANQLSLSAGVCQAFEEMLTLLGYDWLTPVMCVLLAYGAFAMVITWINGPTKGLLEVAKEGYLPRFWQYRNSCGAPTHTLLTQAAFTSLISINILFVPTISNAFWIMSVMCSELYMIMYMLMFAAAIRLRYKNPDIKRPFCIPGGKPVIWAVAGVAFLTSFFAMVTGFIPPQNIVEKGTGAMVGYIAFIGISVIFFTFIPLFFFKRFETARAKEDAAKAHETAA